MMKASNLRSLCTLLENISSPLQNIVVSINRAIGAAAVAHPECKAIVSQYGRAIMDLLLAKVKHALYFFSHNVIYP